MQHLQRPDGGAWTSFCAIARSTACIGDVCLFIAISWFCNLFSCRLAAYRSIMGVSMGVTGEGVETQVPVKA